MVVNRDEARMLAHKKTKARVEHSMRTYVGSRGTDARDERLARRRGQTHRDGR
jgi:hypothetical protein